MIVDYKLVQVSPTRALTEILEAIKEGWQPYGNLVVNANGMWVQPMVKEDTQNN